ncbi:MAG: hypothetical protein QUS07_04340 [Methanothrix sp.]|nr:hypothetical protein [Methanothrix sp.]
MAGFCIEWANCGSSPPQSASNAAFRANRSATFTRGSPVRGLAAVYRTGCSKSARRARSSAVFVPVLHRHAIDEQVVEGVVVGQERGGIGVDELAEGLLERGIMDGPVELDQDGADSAAQEDFVVVLTLGRREVGAGDDGVAEGSEYVQSYYFNIGFSYVHI